MSCAQNVVCKQRVVIQQIVLTPFVIVVIVCANVFDMAITISKAALFKSFNFLLEHSLHSLHFCLIHNFPIGIHTNSKLKKEAVKSNMQCFKFPWFLFMLSFRFSIISVSRFNRMVVDVLWFLYFAF